MKVSELVNKLIVMPPDANVVVGKYLDEVCDVVLRADDLVELA